MVFDVLTVTFSNLLSQAASFLLNLLAALAVFLIGYFIAGSIGRVVEFLLRKLQVEVIFERLGLDKFFKNVGFGGGVPGFAGWLVKWFIVVVVLIAVTESLGLPQISFFINQVSLYIPNVIAAVIILIIGVVVADALSSAVYHSAQSSGFTQAGVTKTLVKWAILVFTFLAVFAQLRLATELIQTLFAGIVAALALGIGLAFGLGGQEKAKDLVNKFFQNLQKKS